MFDRVTGYTSMRHPHLELSVERNRGVNDIHQSCVQKQERENMKRKQAGNIS